METKFINIWGDSTKAVLRGKFITLNTYIRKGKRRKKIPNVDRDAEQLECSYTAREVVNQYNRFGKQLDSI